jgi:5-methylcytosine-specific restriction endonuclease McrA
MAAQVTDEARDWRREYKEYINSPEWTVIRKAAYRRADGRCNRCKRRGVLHAHHLTYVRFGGAELPEDLEVLCEKCHTAEHAPKRAKRDAAVREVSHTAG